MCLSMTMQKLKKKTVLVHVSQNVLLQQTENVTLVKFNDIKSKPQIKV